MVKKEIFHGFINSITDERILKHKYCNFSFLKYIQSMGNDNIHPIQIEINDWCYFYRKEYGIGNSTEIIDYSLEMFVRTIIEQYAAQKIGFLSWKDMKSYYLEKRKEYNFNDSEGTKLIIQNICKAWK